MKLRPHLRAVTSKAPTRHFSKGFFSLRLFKNYLDFVIITARNKKWLLIVKSNTTDWTIVLLKLFNHCVHSVIFGSKKIQKNLLKFYKKFSEIFMKNFKTVTYSPITEWYHCVVRPGSRVFLGEKIDPLPVPTSSRILSAFF